MKMDVTASYTPAQGTLQQENRQNVTMIDTISRSLNQMSVKLIDSPLSCRSTIPARAARVHPNRPSSTSSSARAAFPRAV